MNTIDLPDCIENDENNIDPIVDIVDYLVRIAKISFKNAHLNENDVKTSEKIKMACDLYSKSPTEFLIQYGKYLAPNHIIYFETLISTGNCDKHFEECIKQLKIYHSKEIKHKRIRNRRYKALQKLQNETDYFSEKQMMSRNPLLYEQLIGQYLTDDEINDRDGVDREDLTFVNLILETVDRNQMREMKNEQMLAEDLDSIKLSETSESSQPPLSNTKQWGEFIEDYPKKPWGGFDKVDTRPSFKPEVRRQAVICARERQLLREEFIQEMFSSFIEGRDTEIDYNDIDNDEQYDDLRQLSQDEEDRYFDSEANENDNLEEHMKLVQEYGRRQSFGDTSEDPLDEFMTHIHKKSIIEKYFY